MPRRCTVCDHPELAAIDRALISGESSYQIAAQYSSLSRAAVERHKASHLPEKLLQAREVEKITNADSLKAELETVKADVGRLKGKAEEDGDYRTALIGCDKALKALELQGKLLQLIDERPQVNVLVSAEWVQIRTAMLEALAPFPEARVAVAGRLAELEAGDGE